MGGPRNRSSPVANTQRDLGAAVRSDILDQSQNLTDRNNLGFVGHATRENCLLWLSPKHVARLPPRGLRGRWYSFTTEFHNDLVERWGFLTGGFHTQWVESDSNDLHEEERLPLKSDSVILQLYSRNISRWVSGGTDARYSAK